ncbi:FkbM family methyltransferase [Ensifer sp. NBAIM29]|nr:FkbM family methyltransferase [Ensifer sp. NBAIM29]
MFFNRNKKDELNRLAAEVETLKKEVNRLRRSTYNKQELASIFEDKLEKFTKYQNSLAIAIAAYTESSDKIFDIYHEGTKAKFYLPNGGSDAIQREIIRTSYFYQPKPLLYMKNMGLLKQGGVFVDVGANIGNHTVFMGVVVKSARILSFEPNPMAFEVLRRNVALNFLDHAATTFNVGLGEMAQKARNAGHKLTNMGGNSLIADEGGDISVMRLDDLDLSSVDLLKIDVEGHGAGVVRGGWETIGRCKPVILMEASSDQEREAVSGLKVAFGYREKKQFGHDVLLTAD